MEIYGALDSSMNWTCGFSIDDISLCSDEATWHGFLLNEDGSAIQCMMASCDDHLSHLETNYRHEMQSPCGVPGSRFKWPENHCYIDWDKAEEKLRPIFEPKETT